MYIRKIIDMRYCALLLLKALQVMYVPYNATEMRKYSRGLIFSTKSFVNLEQLFNCIGAFLARDDLHNMLACASFMRKLAFKLGFYGPTNVTIGKFTVKWISIVIQNRKKDACMKILRCWLVSNLSLNECKPCSALLMKQGEWNKGYSTGVPGTKLGPQVNSIQPTHNSGKFFTNVNKTSVCRTADSVPTLTYRY